MVASFVHILAGLFAPSMMMRVACVGVKLNFPCFIERSWRCGVCGGKVSAMRDLHHIAKTPPEGAEVKLLEHIGHPTYFTLGFMGTSSSLVHVDGFLR
ncbi:hypothetical protein U1Q18_042359 [Sarracenia purpurea var. burkii]